MQFGENLPPQNGFTASSIAADPEHTPHRPSATSCRRRFCLMITESVKVWHHSPLHVVPSGRCRWRSPSATHPPLLWRRCCGSTTGQVRCWRKKRGLSPTVALRHFDEAPVSFSCNFNQRQLHFYRLALTMVFELKWVGFCHVWSSWTPRPQFFSILLVFLGNISNFYYMNLSSVRNTEKTQPPQHHLHRGWLSVTV